MGRKDAATKEYMKDNEVFADAFNFLIYGGRQVIEPDRLLPMDTAQIARRRGGESEYVQSDRGHEEGAV